MIFNQSIKNIVAVFSEKIMKNNLKMVGYLEMHNQVLYLVKVKLLFNRNLFLASLNNKNQNNKNRYLETRNRNYYLDNQ
jgi:hypothetical protein